MPDKSATNTQSSSPVPGSSDPRPARRHATIAGAAVLRASHRPGAPAASWRPVDAPASRLASNVDTEGRGGRHSSNVDTEDAEHQLHFNVDTDKVRPPHRSNIDIRPRGATSRADRDLFPADGESWPYGRHDQTMGDQSHRAPRADEIDSLDRFRDGPHAPVDESEDFDVQPETAPVGTTAAREAAGPAKPVITEPSSWTPGAGIDDEALADFADALADNRAPSAPASATDTTTMPVPKEKPLSAPRRLRPMPLNKAALEVSAPPAVPPPSVERIDLISSAKKSALEKRAKERNVQTIAPDGVAPRTPATVQAYRERGEMLVRRFRRDFQVSEDVDQFDVKAFAYWFLSLRPTLKPSTWRLYRQSAIMALSGVASANAEEALAIIENDAPAEAEMGTGTPVAEPTEGRITSANKQKQVLWDDWMRIDAWLVVYKRSEVADHLRDWLRAGLATGLRPAEWQATDITRVDDPSHPNGQRVYLLVLNAKSTNGRANGLVRTLDISDVTLASQGAIERMSSRGAKWFSDGVYDLRQRKVSEMLYRLSESFWRKRSRAYALYSCRHQFIANMKALKVPNAEVSAMVGHLVDQTTAESYAKKKTAWSPDKILDKPKAIESEAGSVERRMAMTEERQRLIAIAKGHMRIEVDGAPIAQPEAETGA